MNAVFSQGFFERIVGGRHYGKEVGEMLGTI